MAEQALDPAVFAEIEIHIDTCESCRKIVAAAVTDSSLAMGTPAVDDVEPLARFIEVAINERYVVKAMLGRGGMGTVYLARDLSLDREVALKLHRAGSGSERLHREAMAMAKLAHPNVVAVFEVATVEDRLYVAMEYVRGETLRGWLAAAPRTWRPIIAMLLETGKGLVAAHAAGLVHRDFKLENVLVGDDGRPRVGDFGLARVGASPSTTFRRHAPALLERDVATLETERAPGNTPLDVNMTETGALVGTPAYMAPEQLAGDSVDARCDQFAFCVVAWECLFGKRPFSGKTITALHIAIEQREIQRPTKTDVPQRVRMVLERGLATDPGARYPDMAALLVALRDAAAPRTRKRLALAAVAVAGIAAITVPTVMLLGQRRDEAACAAAGDEMLRVFDGARRDQIRAAFTSTGSPSAGIAFERASDVLGRYTKVLATRATSACRGLDEPARVTAARRECLADRRRELAAFTELLTTADKPLVQRVPSAVWSLYDPEPCDDTQTLLARARTSTESMTQEQAAELRRLKALSDAGRYEAAIAGLTPIVNDARTAGNASLELAALLELANAESNLESPNTRAHLDRAVALAESLGRDLDAAQSYAALASFAGTVSQEYAEAHRFIGLARAKLQRLGGKNPALRGDLLMTEAQILLDDNRLGEAEGAMRQAVATMEQAYGNAHPKLGAALGTLSQIERAQRKEAESLVTSTRTLEVLERSLGADHPTVAGAHMNLAQGLMATKRYSEAREHLLRADIVFARVFGDFHPTRAAIAGNLGGLEQLQGNWDAALVASRRAVAILEKLQGPDSADVSGARRDVARELVLAGRTAEAIAEQTRALAILDKLGADGEGRMVSGLTELATFELEAKQHDAAIKHAERALALAKKRPADANPVELADAQLALANGLWESKRDRARARALVAEARSTTPDPERRAELDAWLAAHP